MIVSKLHGSNLNSESSFIGVFVLVKTLNLIEIALLRDSVIEVTRNDFFFGLKQLPIREENLDY